MGLYNALKFCLGQFTDIHRGSVCAELAPVNIRLMQLLRGSFLFPPLKTQRIVFTHREKEMETFVLRCVIF